MHTDGSVMLYSITNDAFDTFWQFSVLLIMQTLLEQNVTRDLLLNPEFLSLLNGTIDSADEAVPFDTPHLCNDYVPQVGTLLADLRAAGP